MEEILTFLDDVLRNNNRPWFQEHKKQYQTAQANFNALAEQIIAGVQKFDDNCKGLTLKDCTYRFYRDTRFSPDKRPYKTHFGVFVCPEGKKSMLAGYYFHLEAKESEYLGHNMLCTGMYMPDTAMLKTIRNEILFNGEPLVESINKADTFDLDTSKAMKRVPNGYPKDHPYAELFKQRDWLMVQDLPEKRLSDPHLVDWVVSEFEKTKDFCLMAESDGKRGMTSKTVFIMKQTMLAAAFLLSLGWMMASCVNSNPSVNESPKLSIVEETTLPIEEETVDTLIRTYDEAEDTVMFQTYVFFSQPIPKDVELRMRGRSLTDTTKITFDQLRYLTLPYYDYDGHIQSGEMVCNKAIAHDLLCVFRDLFSQAYPIYSIRLVDDFDADDEASMQANNTSCFNYRNRSGVNMLSQHAYGMAVDVNPLQNPCVRGTRFRPSTAAEFVDRSKDFEHKIDENDYCVKVFTAYGFRWGGRWNSTKDYQHFEK